MKIPYLLLIIFLALAIHELGHLIAARKLKIPVEKVKIGRGRLLYSDRDESGTLWCIHAIPIGAHVDIDQALFAARPYWQRFITIIAAPCVNLLLPFIVFIGFYLTIGQPASPPVIAGIQQNLAAEQAGFKPGDRILSINNNTIRSGRDVWSRAYDPGAVDTIFTIERGDQIMSLSVLPEWNEYRDDEGIERAHPRYGIYWWHKATKLKDIYAVNGEVVEKDLQRARHLLIEAFNTEPVVTLMAPGDEKSPYTMILRAANNTALLNPEDTDYERVYFGETKGNFYLHKPAPEQIVDAVLYAWDKITKMALLPFQILPFDPLTIGDEYGVTGKETQIKNIAYDFIHKLAIVSIFIALINLLPFTYLDGGHILIQGLESYRKKPLSRKTKARLFALTFSLFYFSALFANMDNLPRYIDSRIKKLQESIQSQQQEKR